MEIFHKELCICKINPKGYRVPIFPKTADLFILLIVQNIDFAKNTPKPYLRGSAKISAIEFVIKNCQLYIN